MVRVSLYQLAVSGSALLWAPCSSLISGSQKVPAVCAINREHSLQTGCHASICRWPAGPLKRWHCSSGAPETPRARPAAASAGAWRQGTGAYRRGQMCGHFLWSRAEKTLEDEDRRGSDANSLTSGVFKCQKLIVHLSFLTCMLVFFCLLEHKRHFYVVFSCN